MDNYTQALAKKTEKLEKLNATLEATKNKIKDLEKEISDLKLAHDAEQFTLLKKELSDKNYNVDAILGAIKNGDIDLGKYMNKSEE